MTHPLTHAFVNTDAWSIKTDAGVVTLQQWADQIGHERARYYLEAADQCDKADAIVRAFRWKRLTRWLTRLYS